MARRDLSAHRAAQQLVNARRALSQARHALARSTTPREHHVIAGREWSAVRRALDASSARLLATPGVVGVGMGFRRRGGVLHDERCVIVFVRRKFQRDARTKAGRRFLLPRTLADRENAIPVDVVELGAFTRHAAPGDRLGPRDTARWGTLGVFAVDDHDRAPVALTAMHVTGLPQFPPGAEQLLCAPDAPVGAGPLLGPLLRGTQSGIDAAKIRVDAGARIDPNIPGIGAVRGWRPISVTGDRGTYVRMYGAASRRVVYGRIVEPAVALPQRPYCLDSAILIDMPTLNGDSGAAIVDNDNLVLGLLVGTASGLGGVAVCCPIGAILYHLACDIPSHPSH